MKRSGIVAASVAAASAMSISSPSSLNSSSYACNPCIQNSRQDGGSQREYENSSSVKSSSTEKFAPRFDGLRFIETLVTAHR